jgi:hypothetical protein
MTTDTAVVVFATTNNTLVRRVCRYSIVDLPTTNSTIGPDGGYGGTCGNVFTTTCNGGSGFVTPVLIPGGAFLVSPDTTCGILVYDVSAAVSNGAYPWQRYAATSALPTAAADTHGHMVTTINGYSESILNSFAMSTSVLTPTSDIYFAGTYQWGVAIDTSANMYYSTTPTTVWRAPLDSFRLGSASAVTVSSLGSSNGPLLAISAVPNAYLILTYVNYASLTSVRMVSFKLSNCTGASMASCLSDPYYCAWVLHTGTCALKTSAECAGNLTACQYGPIQTCPTLPAAVQCYSYYNTYNGSCAIQFTPIGTPCDDHDWLTQNDSCTGTGLCEGTQECTCPQLPPTAQCIVQNCSGVNHTCLLYPAHVGSSCDDNNPLTHTDVCTAGGVCAGTAYPNCDCPTLPAGVQCVTLGCNVTSGTCRANLSSAGSHCDDGNPLTRNDVCNSVGGCAGAPFPNCDCPTLPAGIQCIVLGCGVGNVCMAIVPIGSHCDDSNPLTYNDLCTAYGTCAGTPVGDCGCEPLPPGVQCIELGCVNASIPDGINGTCALFPLANGHLCDDNDPLTYADACVDGNCVGTPDPNCACPTLPAGTQCITLDCGEDGICAGTLADVGSFCDDGNPLTFHDACTVTGACVGIPSTNCSCLPLPPGIQCYSLGCDILTGVCEIQLATAGTACDDNDPLTVNDTCRANGACVGIAMPNCGCPTLPDGTQCMSLGCVAPGICGVILAAAGSHCDDGDPQSDDDECSAEGVCNGDYLPDCNCPTLPPDVQCMNITCDPDSELCVLRLFAEGTNCSDGSAFTTNDTCTSTGICSGIGDCGCPPVPPGVQCLVIACMPDGSCIASHAPDETPCDDGVAYTTGDVCRAGGICRGTPIQLGNPCEGDSDCDGLYETGPCRSWRCVGGTCELGPASADSACGLSVMDRCSVVSTDVDGTCDALGTCGIVTTEFPSPTCGGAGRACARIGGDYVCVSIGSGCTRSIDWWYDNAPSAFPTVAPISLAGDTITISTVAELRAFMSTGYDSNGLDVLAVALLLARLNSATGADLEPIDVGPMADADALLAMCPPNNQTVWRAVMRDGRCSSYVLSQIYGIISQLIGFSYGHMGVPLC